MGSEKPLRFCRYLELKENIPASRTPGEKTLQPGEPFLTCRAGIHPTLPALRALFTAASLGQVEMFSFTQCHRYRRGWVGAAPGEILPLHLTTCSAKRRKGESWGRPGPALPTKPCSFPSVQGEGGDSPGGRSAGKPAASSFCSRCDDPGGTALPCKLSEPSALYPCTPRSSLPWILRPPSASATSSAALQR